MKFNKLFFLLSLFLILVSSAPAQGDWRQLFRMKIDSLIILADKFPQGNYLEEAYANLEKMKNLFIINVLTDSSSKQLEKILGKTITIHEVQERYLLEDEAILNFMVAEDHVYVFIVTVDSFYLASFRVDKHDLSEQIHNLMSPLFQVKSPLELLFDLDLAHRLYQKIFLPLTAYLNNIRSLIIIPDDMLQSFPFECLVIEENKSNKKPGKAKYDNFKYVTFLVHKYAIAYNFSTNMMVSERHSLSSQKQIGRRLLTMSELTGLSSQVDDSDLGWTMQSPYYGRDEVHRISRLLWYHDNISGDIATADYFRENCSRYRWIYLAIPALMNNLNPSQSALIFSPSSDSSMSNRLSIAELLQYKLRADLLTLNGCELKPPFINNHNGVIGLPQSLLIAGARSVLLNLWRIENITVSRFMAKFYWELKYKRQTNSLALQHTKVTSFKDIFDYHGKEISRAHPYFWASFILIGNGNVRPPTFSTIPPKMVVLIVYITVLIISVVIIRKSIDKK